MTTECVSPDQMQCLTKVEMKDIHLYQPLRKIHALDIDEFKKQGNLPNHKMGIQDKQNYVCHKQTNKLQIIMTTVCFSRSNAMFN
jgi:hypothetical protein